MEGDEPSYFMKLKFWSLWQFAVFYKAAIFFLFKNNICCFYLIIKVLYFVIYLENREKHKE